MGLMYILCLYYIFCYTITANVMNNTTDSNTIIANVVCVNDELRVDMIVEKTLGNGIDIDGILVKMADTEPCRVPVLRA